MPSTIQIIGTVLFFIAIIHTFSTKFFEHLAKTNPIHSGLWHLLGEVEVVFGFWASILVIAMLIIEGVNKTTNYIDSLHFTEPMFVFAIMVVAASRPILRTATYMLHLFARLIPLPNTVSFYISTLIFTPLLGSLITEAAAMTLAAIVLSAHIFRNNVSSYLKYATLGVLFVNISIGGVLTPFSAPPVIMVAAKWHWDVKFMLLTFGWKAAVAVAINTICVTALFYKELSRISHIEDKIETDSQPIFLIVLHFALLIGIIIFSHHTSMFFGIFLFFLGITHAYNKYQDRLILREGLLVAFFLAGLIILGEQQMWWLRLALSNTSSEQLFIGATFLTAIVDNAAITYLGSLLEGFSDDCKYALVSGAITGGGLTIIANAPNLVGVSILREHFEDESIHPLGLLIASILPTIVAAIMFNIYGQ